MDFRGSSTLSFLSTLRWKGKPTQTNSRIALHIEKSHPAWDQQGTHQLRNVDELTSASRRTDLGQVCSIYNHKSRRNSELFQSPKKNPQTQIMSLGISLFYPQNF